jgi:MFS family permease
VSTVVEIRKYYLFQSLKNLEFFGPVLVLFWLSKNLNMTEIMVLQSIFAIGMVALEVPTGALADYCGERSSLSVGALITAIGLLFYGLSSYFWQFVIGELLVATGLAFISGADSAYIHEVLKISHRENEYQRIEGQAQSLSQIARMFSNAASGAIAAVSLGATLVASALANFLGFLVTLTFLRSNISVERVENTHYFQVITDSLIIISGNSQVLWLILFFTFFNSILHTSFFLSQPYMQLVGVPIVLFGIIFAGLNSISAGVSLVTDWLDQKSGGHLFPLLVGSAGFSLLMLSLFPSWLVLPFFGLVTACGIVSQTITSHRILALVPSHRASTILSFQNLSRRLVYALFGPLVGIVSDAHGILWAVRFNLGALLVVFGLIFCGQYLFTLRKSR